MTTRTVGHYPCRRHPPLFALRISSALCRLWSCCSTSRPFGAAAFPIARAGNSLLPPPLPRFSASPAPASALRLPFRRLVSSLIPTRHRHQQPHRLYWAAAARASISCRSPRLLRARFCSWRNHRQVHRLPACWSASAPRGLLSIGSSRRAVPPRSAAAASLPAYYCSMPRRFRQRFLQKLWLALRPQWCCPNSYHGSSSSCPCLLHADGDSQLLLKTTKPQLYPRRSLQRRRDRRFLPEPIGALDACWCCSCEGRSPLQRGPRTNAAARFPRSVAGSAQTTPWSFSRTAASAAASSARDA
mmetsp:Transcript_21531/g.54256  ORF Transcript_21531/g.54256 Transcript_21531/m.54256 type:complete len:301 (-) Transcript_21531:1788-2690(-)